LSPEEAQRELYHELKTTPSLFKALEKKGDLEAALTTWLFSLKPDGDPQD
jgi:hypothetical protein